MEPAAAEEGPRLVTDLPSDALSLVLMRLGLGKGRARNVARTALVCRAFSVAARLAEKALRRACFEGHTNWVTCVAAAPGGRIITCSDDGTFKVWRDGACERTIQGHADRLVAVAMLPGGARFVGASLSGAVKLWTLDGALERTIAVKSSRSVHCVAALPDGVHFVVGLGNEVRLYHVDGTLVHTFTGHTDLVCAVAVTPDGQEPTRCRCSTGGAGA